jgi:hypothetical protein
VLLQVGFYDEKLRRYTKVARKSNPPRPRPSMCCHMPVVTCLSYHVLLQVGFFDEKLRRYAKVARKSNDILNRLEKTRRELQPDFKTEKEVWRGV